MLIEPSDVMLSEFITAVTLDRTRHQLLLMSCILAQPLIIVGSSVQFLSRRETRRKAGRRRHCDQELHQEDPVSINSVNHDFTLYCLPEPFSY